MRLNPETLNRQLCRKLKQFTPGCRLPGTSIGLLPWPCDLKPDNSDTVGSRPPAHSYQSVFLVKQNLKILSLVLLLVKITKSPEQPPTPGCHLCTDPSWALQIVFHLQQQSDKHEKRRLLQEEKSTHIRGEPGFGTKLSSEVVIVWVIEAALRARQRKSLPSAQNLTNLASRFARYVDEMSAVRIHSSAWTVGMKLSCWAVPETVETQQCFWEQLL